MIKTLEKLAIGLIVFGSVSLHASNVGFAARPYLARDTNATVVEVFALREGCEVRLMSDARMLAVDESGHTFDVASVFATYAANTQFADEVIAFVHVVHLLSRESGLHVPRCAYAWMLYSATTIIFAWAFVAVGIRSIREGDMYEAISGVTYAMGGLFASCLILTTYVSRIVEKDEDRMKI